MQEPEQDGNARPWGYADGSLGQRQPWGHAGRTPGAWSRAESGSSPVKQVDSRRVPTGKGRAQEGGSTHSDARPCAGARLVRTKPTWPEGTCWPRNQGRPGTWAPRISMRSPRWKVISSGPEPWQSATAEARPTAAGRRAHGQCWGHAAPVWHVVKPGHPHEGLDIHGPSERAHHPHADADERGPGCWPAGSGPTQGACGHEHRSFSSLLPRGHVHVTGHKATEH